MIHTQLVANEHPIIIGLRKALLLFCCALFPLSVHTFPTLLLPTVGTHSGVGIYPCVFTLHEWYWVTISFSCFFYFMIYF